MTNIGEAIASINAELPSATRLVAVSKYHPVEAIQEAYNAGQRIFGESHEQELRVKVPALPDDIQWHFIGHLQTNKVKYIAPYISLIQSVDTLKLLQEINKQALRCNRVIPCLLQLHIAAEETKFGFTVNECSQMLASGVWREMKGIQLCGIMCMASNTDDEQRIAKDFAQAQAFFHDVKKMYFADDSSFCECSWGMSDDYPIAVKHGSTLVRIGSKIFGNRNY